MNASVLTTIFMLKSLYIKAEKSFFTKKMATALVAVVALALFLFPDSAIAATITATNPLEVMKQVYTEQAQTTAFPMIILWTLVLGIVISFAMGKFMPFILAVIASVIIAITPNIAGNFTGTNFGL